MTTSATTVIDHFFIAGINYKKTDVSIRGKFAVNQTQYASLLEKANSKKLKELFILSTCNRTEIYGIASEAEELITLLCSETEGDIQTFNELAYVKKGNDAVEHLFAVGAGLDSQILGDYEIIGQLKQAAKFAKEKNFIGTFFERLINSVLQSSKCIKSNTGLSSGTVSVSFAAVQFLRNHVKEIKRKNILLIGAGKIGRNTCKYLVGHSEAANVTMMNRTDETAIEIARSLNIKQAPYSKLYKEIEAADIILVSTNAETPVILKKDIKAGKQKILIDLSIPNNIEASAKELSQIDLVNVDDLAKINDATLQKREAEIPKAKAIIAQHIIEFMEWNEMRKHVPVLKAVKLKLTEIHSSALFADTTISPINNTEEKIQRVINGMATKMRRYNMQGCHFIEAINDFITN